MAVAKYEARNIDFDLDGFLNAGGKIATYEGGTLTPLATYAEKTGTTPNANPIELDSSGQAHIFLTVGEAYKFVFMDADDVPMYTEDGITAGTAAAASGSLYADFEFEYPGGPPLAATAATTAGWLGGRSIVRAVSFAANFAGSHGFALTAPTASYVATVRKNATLNDNGTQIGTVTVSTGGLYTFATTTGAAQTLSIGETLHVFGPAVADATIADFGFTLAGSLA